VDRTPVVRSIYNAVKQIVETIFSQSQSSFQKACLIQYPRQGIWAVAFVSTDVVMLDMSVEDAAKLIISAGLVIPPTAEEIKAGRRPAARQSPKTAA